MFKPKSKSDSALRAEHEAIDKRSQKQERVDDDERELRSCPEAIQCHEAFWRRCACQRTLY